MLSSVIRVPKLRCDKEFFSCDDAIFYGFVDSFANLFFIAIITGAVEKTIATLNSFVDD